MKSDDDTPPRRLIVNADDFGFSESVNAGIARAHAQGILTSATLLANGAAFRDAVRTAAEHPALGVGIHLNLVRGKPLSPPDTVPLLMDAAGCFRRFRVRRLTRAFLAQAEREYRAQFEKVLEAGIVPTHADFEKHHAWQGPLYRLAGRLAAEYGAVGLRTLSEPVWFAVRRVGWPGFRRAGLAALLRAGFALGGGAHGATCARPDWFFGQTHIGGMTERLWLRLLSALPPGVSEVMTHPGEATDGHPEEAAGGHPGEATGGHPEEATDGHPGEATDGHPGASWIDACRAAELEALVSPSVRAAATSPTLSLITYRDLTKPNTPPPAIPTVQPIPHPEQIKML